MLAYLQPLFRRKARELFGIDSRSRALFRIFLGQMILITWINRSMHLADHYTDFGVLPRASLLGRIGLEDPYVWSLMLANGEWPFIALFIVLGVVFATFLIVGYKTQFAAVSSWILLLSLHNRNPMAIGVGDVPLCILLFFALFLPLGAAWSVDAARRPAEAEFAQAPCVFSAASIALLAQVVLMYFFAAILKHDRTWTQDGTALALTLHLDQFATPFAKWVLSQPNLLDVTAPLTIVVRNMEMWGWAGAFIPICTGPFRLFTVVAFWGLHAGIELTLEVGLLSYICMTAWIPFLSSWTWDVMLPSFTRHFPCLRNVWANVTWRLYYLSRIGLDPGIRPSRPWEWGCSENVAAAVFYVAAIWLSLDLLGSSRLWIPFTEPSILGVHRVITFFIAITSFCVLLMLAMPAKTADFVETTTRRSSMQSLKDGKTALSNGLKWAANAFVLFCLAYVIMWNIRTTNFWKYEPYFPRSWNSFGFALGLDQYWGMCAPRPATDDVSFIIPGQLENGMWVDLFRPRNPPSYNYPCWRKPSGTLSSEYGSDSWRVYFAFLAIPDNEVLRHEYASYLCRKWNAAHSEGYGLEHLQLWKVVEPTLVRENELPSEIRVGELRYLHLLSRSCLPAKTSVPQNDPADAR